MNNSYAAQTVKDGDAPERFDCGYSSGLHMELRQYLGYLHRYCFSEYVRVWYKEVKDLPEPIRAVGLALREENQPRFWEMWLRDEPYSDDSDDDWNFDPNTFSVYHTFLWLLNCTNIISGTYVPYFVNIYVFCMFPQTNTPQFRLYQVQNTYSWRLEVYSLIQKLHFPTLTS